MRCMSGNGHRKSCAAILLGGLLVAEGGFQVVGLGGDDGQRGGGGGEVCVAGQLGDEVAEELDFLRDGFALEVEFDLVGHVIFPSRAAVFVVSGTFDEYARRGGLQGLSSGGLALAGRDSGRGGNG